MCPHDDQDRLLQHFLDRAQSGSQWAANMLQLTPCDLWPFIQGRTIWLMGDSIMQVGGHCLAHGGQHKAGVRGLSAHETQHEAGGATLSKVGGM